MFRTISRTLLALVLAAAVLSVAPPPAAEAQILEKSPFFLRLFGLKERQRPAPGPRILKVPPPGRGGGPLVLTPDGARATGPKILKPAPPAIALKPKDPDAKVVLVVGDAFAGGLALGLEVAFADTPSVRIATLAAEGAGLSSPEPLDLRGKLEERLKGEDPPDALVVMLGLADRLPIPVDGREAAFRTRPWETVYRARAKALVAAARAKSLPVYWVGLVPTADPDLTTDLAYLDEVYRQEAQATLGVYVDVWNAFADPTGGFAMTGADVEGQSRRLRLRDGVGFTKSGNRKLAFYVEQELRAWIATGRPGVVLPTTDAAGGLVVSLSDPDVGPDEDFAVEGPQPAPETGSALHRLVVEGRPLKPRVGRVDDLSRIN